MLENAKKCIRFKKKDTEISKFLRGSTPVVFKSAGVVTPATPVGDAPAVSANHFCFTKDQSSLGSLATPAPDSFLHLHDGGTLQRFFVTHVVASLGVTCHMTADCDGTADS